MEAGNCFSGRFQALPQFLQVDPFSLLPALDSGFRELDSLGSFHEVVGERFVEGDMAEKQLPLDLESIVVFDGIGNFLPALVKVDRLFDVGIPDWFGGGAKRLDPAFPKANGGGSFCSVHVHHEEVVPPHADIPGAVELADDSVVQLERRIAAVIGGALVDVPRFIDSLGNVGGAEAGDTLDLSEDVIDKVTPVAEHIDDDAAAIFLAIVPAGTLSGLISIVTGEDPVAELTANGENLTEEPLIDQGLELSDSGEPELVLNHTVLHPGITTELGEANRFGGFNCSRFFAVDRFACFDGHFDEAGAMEGGTGIKKDLVSFVGESGVEIGRPALDSKAFCQGLQLVFIAAREDGIDFDDLVGRNLDAALLPDREDGSDEVLIGAHASCDAVHNDTDAMCFHEELGGVID